MRDAGRAPDDAPLVEVGLMYVDAAATVTASDALSVADAPSPYCQGVCSPVKHTGCTGDCILVGESTVCGAAGLLPEGSVCSNAADCADGLACFDNGSGPATCAMICCPGDDACGADATCGGSGLLVGGVSTSWGRCLPQRRCTVLTPTSACTDREACYIVDALGATECQVAGSRLVGEACEVPNDCAPDLACVGASNRMCVALCSLGTTSACARGMDCVRQAYTPDGIGLCVPGAAL